MAQNDALLLLLLLLLSLSLVPSAVGNKSVAESDTNGTVPEWMNAIPVLEDDEKENDIGRYGFGVIKKTLAVDADTLATAQVIAVCSTVAAMLLVLTATGLVLWNLKIWTQVYRETVFQLVREKEKHIVYPIVRELQNARHFAALVDDKLKRKGAIVVPAKMI